MIHETGITNVTDPLAGSYYIESLTNKMEEEARKVLQQIEEQGGFIKALKNGWIVGRCRENAQQWRDGVESGEKVIIGVNKYVMPEDREVELFKIDPEVERIAIERVKKYRAERDQAKTDAALNRLKEASQRVKQGEHGLLMPATIEAAKAKATMGEISKTLQQVFRWGPQYSSAVNY